MNSSTAHAGTLMPWMNATIACGMPLTVSSQENTPAAATMTMTCAVRMTESTATVQIPLQVDLLIDADRHDNGVYAGHTCRLRR